MPMATRKGGRRQRRGIGGMGEGEDKEMEEKMAEVVEEEEEKGGRRGPQ